MVTNKVNPANIRVRNKFAKTYPLSPPDTDDRRKRFYVRAEGTTTTNEFARMHIFIQKYNFFPSESFFYDSCDRRRPGDIPLANCGSAADDLSVGPVINYRIGYCTYTIYHRVPNRFWPQHDPSCAETKIN